MMPSKMRVHHGGTESTEKTRMGSKHMVGYLLAALGAIVAVSAFVVRSPAFIIINGLLVEFWLIALFAALIVFTTGAVMILRSIN